MERITRNVFRAAGGVLLAVIIGIGGAPASALAGYVSTPVRLHDHVPLAAVAKAQALGRVPGANAIQLALSLPLRNQQELEELLIHLYDPADPLYGHYLTSQEFTDRFAPTQEDYDAVAAYAQSIGLTVTGTHPNRTLLDVRGPAAAIEAGFNLHLNNHLAPDGRMFYAPDNDPAVPDFIAQRIGGVIGLDNSAVWHTHSRPEDMKASPLQIGTGPNGGLAPADIVTAYNLSGVTAAGSGQTLGLFELDGYNQSDVTSYENYFFTNNPKFPNFQYVPLQNVLVDGVSGRAGTGADEVTLDIELQIALAPRAARIIVYEGPNSNTGVVDTYNRIATDNLATQISTSWGLSEGQSSPATMSSENAAFTQMALQGQSIYAASGDNGAYDNGSALSVDDPASQPYMVGVGGTQLYVNTGETYNRETVWNVNNTVNGGAGGGGVSVVWSIPSWQLGVAGTASATMRNVPDVSLNADQYTGYAIFYRGGWTIYGGTSCAAPLWAAFTARVNQQRTVNGMAHLGFANPTLYPLAANHGADFHDVTTGTNLYYAAGAGYDNATGLGSFNGATMLNDLAPVTPPTTSPPVPTGLTATAGNGSVTLSWGASSGATSYSVYRSITTGGEGLTPFQSGITATTFTDTAVTNGTTYYYQVSATNSIGTSNPSGEVSATPVAPPALAITSGPTATAGKAFAQIQWSTNLPATSVVSYGTSLGNLTATVSNASAVSSHSVKVSPLARHTTYYYKVSSTANGITVSSSGTDHFTTQ